MSRRSLIVRLAGAAVGIVAIALAAATIDDPTEPGGSGGTGGDGTGTSPPPEPEPMDQPNTFTDVPAFLEYLLIALVAVIAIVFAWYLITHRRDAVKMITVMLVAIGLVWVVFTIVAGFDASPQMNETVGEMADMNDSGGEPGTGDGTRDDFPAGTILTMIGVATAIFVGALVLSRRGSSSATDAAIEPSAEPDDAAAVGAAAGRAAQRIETSGDDVDNEVYRAWRDMVRPLEVPHPETSTPREFATAATEAGLAREHVDELTRLFEDVRYGHATTTDEMESRALSVLRRIEDEYAETDVDYTRDDES